MLRSSTLKYDKNLSDKKSSHRKLGKKNSVFDKAFNVSFWEELMIIFFYSEEKWRICIRQLDGTWQLYNIKTFFCTNNKIPRNH